jgi:cytochrome c oxidase subunit 1
MVGAVVMGYLGGLHFWWPKMTGRMYPEAPAKVAAVLIFVGFFFTFVPQFILGYLGMPRRYASYPPEFQILNVLSTAGATVMALGYFLAAIYLFWSLKYGKIAGPNPWNAAGLEWQTSSPPLRENFVKIPIVDHEAYNYEEIDAALRRQTVGTD